MTRKILITLVALLLIMSCSIFAASAVKSSQQVYIDGRLSEAKGYNINGYNYFRLRDLQRAMFSAGLRFSLAGDANSIAIGLNAQDIVPSDAIALSERALAVEKNLSVTNGAMTKMLSAYNINGYNYFKLRDMEELLGITADYRASDNAVVVAISANVDSLLVGGEKTEPIIPAPVPTTDKVVLGNERLLAEYSYLVDGKRIGLITNQTGVNSSLIPTGAVLKNYANATLSAIYSPEHGYDGLAPAGEYVESYFHEGLGLNVYSLYGKTRKPTPEMLSGIDVLVFDMQDIGSRTYTYMSTLNYAMRAAAENGLPIIVLDRPNPVGGKIVEGFVLEERFATFVGVDELPMAHGMTAGELALFFNRKIGADLKVVEMKNYTRDMVWQDTGLNFVQTSPNIPNIESAFNYMATGIGDGTGFGQADKFKFAGAKGLDAVQFADAMNAYGLPGVRFNPMTKGERGGVELVITDYHAYNPQLTGTYLLATANLMTKLNAPLPKGADVPMFTKISGTVRMAQMMLEKKMPQEIVASYQAELSAFMQERAKYLIYK